MKTARQWFVVLLLLVLAAEASARRYSYDTCANAVMLWCRHQSGVDQPTCVARNVRQCADCVTYRDLREMRGEPDTLEACREWLDGTLVRVLRDAQRKEASAR